MMPTSVSRPFHFKFLLASFALLGAMASACAPQGGSSPLKPADGENLFQKKNIGKFELAKTYQVALTFDDGPRAGVTDKLLDLLKRENIRATFFVLGEHVRGNEALLARMKAEGHVIGNHSYSHGRMSDEAFVLDPDKVVREIQRTHQLIKPYLQPGGRAYFRAPYGAWLPDHAARLNAIPELSKYIGPVYWTAGGDMELDKSGQVRLAADWACWSSNYNLAPVDCASSYYREVTARGGGVTLMHDHDLRTVALTEILIAWLKDEGYGFVTLDQMTTFEQFNQAPQLKKPIAASPASSEVR